MQKIPWLEMNNPSGSTFGSFCTTKGEGDVSGAHFLLLTRSGQQTFLSEVRTFSFSVRASDVSIRGSLSDAQTFLSEVQIFEND